MVDRGLIMVKLTNYWLIIVNIELVRGSALNHSAAESQIKHQMISLEAGAYHQRLLPIGAATACRHHRGVDVDPRHTRALEVLQ